MIGQYELVFIMTPVLSEDQMAETVKKYAKLVKDAKGEVVFEDSWGLKKLAYPIQKKSTGYYHTLEFKVAGEEIANMELLLKRDEKILRFLTVKLDKHAIAYNIMKRENAKNTKKVEEKDTSASSEQEPARTTDGDQSGGEEVVVTDQEVKEKDPPASTEETKVEETKVEETKVEETKEEETKEEETKEPITAEN